MQIFIDTADTHEISQAVAMGIIDGVTTNPTLAAKSGKTFKELILEICKIVDGPVSAEVTALDAEAMVREGEILASWHPNVVVKVPLTSDGLKATRLLHQKGIHTNVTLCFSATQAILAAKAGATYVSPFIGRLDDISMDGLELISDIRTIYDNYNFTTKILTASVRHPMHVVEAAKIGTDVITAPWSVLSQLVKHPLTDSGLKRFLEDWEKAKK